MYPYFQKNQKPNPSNSSKLSVREALPILCGNFWRKTLPSAHCCFR